MGADLGEGERTVVLGQEPVDRGPQPDRFGEVALPVRRVRRDAVRVRVDAGHQPRRGCEAASRRAPPAAGGRTGPRPGCGMRTRSVSGCTEPAVATGRVPPRRGPSHGPATVTDAGPLTPATRPGQAGGRDSVSPTSRGPPRTASMAPGARRLLQDPPAPYGEPYGVERETGTATCVAATSPTLWPDHGPGPTPLGEPARQRDLYGEDGRLGEVGPVGRLSRPAAAHPSGTRRVPPDESVALLEGLTYHGEPGVEIRRHARPLTALTGEHEHGRGRPRGRPRLVRHRRSRAEPADSYPARPRRRHTGAVRGSAGGRQRPSDRRALRSAVTRSGIRRSVRSVPSGERRGEQDVRSGGSSTVGSPRRLGRTFRDHVRRSCH